MKKEEIAEIARVAAVEVLSKKEEMLDEEFDARYQDVKLLMMSHVDKMLVAYEAMCKEAGDSDEARRWDAVYLRYIDPARLSVDDIAAELHVDKRTFYRDIGKAMDDLAVLLFGIEAIGTWKHKR